MRIKTLIAGICGLSVIPLAGAGVASAATRSAGPTFQLPFPCGETWVGSSKSYAHTGNEIDFNGSANDGNADIGRTVVASAAGTVVMSEYRTADGYGNVVKIRHSDGSVTLYAHLNSRTVSKGANVAQGQKIGTVGKSSAKYNIIAHLHYEQRSSSGSILPATFNGARYQYPNQTLTSKNCGGGSAPSNGGGTSSGSSSNPYSAEQVCGAGFKAIDSAPLGSQGKVVLLYSTSTGENCVVTLRNSASGKAAMRAYLEVKGQARKTDAGSFQYYAGPVRAKAPRTCVKWGGAIGSAVYDSPFEHCD
ncbi:M23 family metallopeptidase [Nonomuraea pusilla]|uniref:Peptidase family M23 n=1 Tax=Nonomuraea pusilla TaxID=46177 RepID=A0A1H7V8B3_9ACTN|nr:M23 family metallopeptidase [Nonomuraea pusilla]SEM05264.1 Peptidase family M23 [Nonomuraea pusilla]